MRSTVCCAMLASLVCLYHVRQACGGIVTAAAPGYSISWDGNDGDFFSAANPAPAPASIATSPGVTAFGSSELGLGTHFIVNIKNGTYGNSSSWIGAYDAPNPSYVGLNLAGSYQLTGIAWGRDNGNNVTDACGGQCGDRSLGVYAIEFTQVGSPGVATPVTGNPLTGWAPLGTLNYQSSDDTVVGGAFTSYFRHQYGITTSGGAPVAATAVRLVVPDNTGIGSGTAVDELELYGSPVVLAETGGPLVLGNVAAQSAGGVAFAKDVLPGYAAHSIPHLNDETYGNSNSWIANSANSFAGVAFDGPQMINTIAFGRDNGGEPNQYTDRFQGAYTLQYTTVPLPDETTPDSAWTTIANLTYTATYPDATGYLRHLWKFDPIRDVTGVRILTSANGIAIDEIEVGAVPEPATMVLGLLGFVGFAAITCRRRRGPRGTA